MEASQSSDVSETGSSMIMSDESEESVPWITWFCSQKGHEYFCEVDEEFIRDEFNLTGLNTIVPHYRLSIDIILDYESIENVGTSRKKIERCTEILYGLIHARFILTHKGMKYMEIKFKAGHFGKCPRALCEGQNCLPVSTHDFIGESHVLQFCPSCQETYIPRYAEHRSIDGAYFGSTFAHLYLLVLKNQVPSPSLIEEKSAFSYVPKIFGFRLYKSFEHR